MYKCNFCDTEVNNGSFEYKDSFGNTYQVCEKCHTKANVEHKCRKCNTESGILIEGYCEKCIQAARFETDKIEEEQRMGVGEDSIEYGKGSVEMTDEVFENWMLLSNNSLSPEDFAKDRYLRFLWVMVKLRAIGITDNKLISKKFNTIEKILNRSFEKLKGTKCTLVIAYNDEMRKWAESSDIIDSEEDVYILRGL